MSSKSVTDRQKSADAVIAAARTHAGIIADQLSSMVKPYYKKGSNLPDLQTFVIALADVLQSAKDNMVAADQAHERELADDSDPRTAREQAFSSLSDYLIQAREIAVGLYGAKAMQSVGFLAIPKDPVVLHRYAGELSTSLRTAQLPKPRVKGAQWDAVEVANVIDNHRKILDEHIQTVARETREAQATLDAKTRAIDFYDCTYAGVSSSLSGLLTLAGKRELAQKLRPSVRHPGQLAEDDEPEASPVAPAA